MRDFDITFGIMLTATIFYCVGHISGWHRFSKKFNNAFKRVLDKSDELELGSHYKSGWLSCLDYLVKKML